MSSQDLRFRTFLRIIGASMAKIMKDFIKGLKFDYGAKAILEFLGWSIIGVLISYFSYPTDFARTNPTVHVQGFIIFTGFFLVGTLRSLYWLWVETKVHPL